MGSLEEEKGKAYVRNTNLPRYFKESHSNIHLRLFANQFLESLTCGSLDVLDRYVIALKKFGILVETILLTVDTKLRTIASGFGFFDLQS